MGESLLSLPEVMRRTGKSKSAIYAGIQADPPTFPAPKKDGRRSAWPESVIDAWIEALPEYGEECGARHAA